ncbi:MAG: polyribonucleotide nucleotidyltransferase [bacterium]
MSHKEEMVLGGRTLSIEVGKVAKQADGSAWVRYGDTIVLAAAVSAKEPMEADFLPLMVDYREKLYAAGKIPGGFFKREGRPAEQEILAARLIDRPIRPLFPKEYRCDTQILVSVFSADGDNPADVIGSIAASTALAVSDIPFDGPIASVRIGLIDGEYVLNPINSQIEQSPLDLVVAGSDDSIIMVEGVAKEIAEAVMIGAIEFAHEHIRQIIGLQNRLREKIGVKKRFFEAPVISEELIEEVRRLSSEKLQQVCHIAEKAERRQEKSALEEAIFSELVEKYPEADVQILEAFDKIYKETVRRMVLTEQRRLDGRRYDEIRTITCEIGLLPRAHGSALFTRGQTQSLATATLGTKVDEQRVDSLEGEYFRRFMFHYNFPPYSTGEAKKFLGTGRREIGHGNLAERSLQQVIPPWETFPYTIRVVSDILESNGSSSMASVCSGSLALMDAGIPVKSHVAGIAMRLIKEKDGFVILTDILGDEDHLGDMDFKVAGTHQGITAFQMDIKIKGMPTSIMRQALEQAQEARFFILDRLEECIPAPKADISPFAPRIITLHVPVELIGAIIGPGGKNIREIVEKSGATVDIMDNGQVNIASTSGEAGETARNMILRMLEVPEVGKIYVGTVKKITDFGAFVEILPGKEGLLHISEIDKNRIEKVSDHLNVGDEVEVKLLSIEFNGKMDLSRRAVLIEREGGTAVYERRKPPRQDRPEGHGGRDRGGFRRDRDRK